MAVTVEMGLRVGAGVNARSLSPYPVDDPKHYLENSLRLDMNFARGTCTCPVSGLCLGDPRFTVKGSIIQQDHLYGNKVSNRLYGTTFSPTDYFFLSPRKNFMVEIHATGFDAAVAIDPLLFVGGRIPPDMSYALILLNGQMAMVKSVNGTAFAIAGAGPTLPREGGVLTYLVLDTFFVAYYNGYALGIGDLSAVGSGKPFAVGKFGFLGESSATYFGSSKITRIKMWDIEDSYVADRRLAPENVIPLRPN